MTFYEIVMTVFIFSVFLHVSLFILFPKFIFSINPSLWQKYDWLAFGEAVYK